MSSGERDASAARDADVLAALAVLLDKQAIADTLARYCRGVDRIDLELMRSVFHVDAVADYGAMFNGSGYEFADFIAQVHPAMEAHSHHIGGITIAVAGDRAGSECYVIVRLRSRSAEGVATDTISHGRYVDRWERRDGVWRIAHRQYLHVLDDTRDVETIMFEPGGSRDRADPSYDVLGENRP